MPLLPGKKKSTIAANVRELIAAGHPPKQAYAIAIKKAGGKPHHPGKG